MSPPAWLAAMRERTEFRCTEFAGCSPTHCCYPGEDDCARLQGVDVDEAECTHTLLAFTETLAEALGAIVIDHAGCPLSANGCRSAGCRQDGETCIVDAALAAYRAGPQ